MIAIKMLQANYGDSFLVQIEPNNEREQDINILIDCGFNYNKAILPFIKALQEDDKILDRFIITHYDSDHIRNAGKFIRDNGQYADPKIIKIEQIWMNTFRHLQFSKRKETIGENDKQNLKTFIRIGSPDDETEGQIGAEQAIFAGHEIYRNGYPWNADFGNQAACIENLQEIQLNNSVSITLLSPTKSKLEKLEHEFIKVLANLKIEVADDILLDDAFEIYSRTKSKEESSDTEYEISGKSTQVTEAFIKQTTENFAFDPDDGIANGSSISFVLHSKNSKVLFLADAHTDDIITQLKTIYPDSNSYPIIFDAIKIAHHGSKKNSNPELLELIDSPIYLISTSGNHPSHQHPDIEVMCLIINRKLSGLLSERKLFFNYELPHLKGFCNEVLQKKFHYSMNINKEIRINEQ